MNAPSSEARRKTLMRPPAPRRAPSAAGPQGRDDAGSPGPAVPFAALATLLGLTVGAGPNASYTFRLDGTDGLAVGASGTGAYRTVPDLAMRMVFDEFSFSGVALPGGMEERVIGGAVYVRSGLLGPGADWARVPLEGSATGVGDLDRLLARAREVTADPDGGTLPSLLDAGRLAPVGAEAVDGVLTTHFAGELTLDDAPPPAGPVPQGHLGIARLGMDVWVGPDGRAHRFVALAPTPAGQIRMALTFTGTVAPAIEVPPAAR
jgi:hypothetical protein